MSAEVKVRLLDERDSIDELTNLLHDAYRVLAEMGFRYVATWQGPDITRKRIAKGKCFVATHDDRLIGTVLLSYPPKNQPCDWYRRSDVALFQQFAVAPDMQGTGIGSQLLGFVESRARELGARHLACDTSEGATHLIRYYERRGFRIVDTCDWEATNYKSVILSKPLTTQTGDIGMQQVIEQAFENKESVSSEAREAVRETLKQLSAGKIRVAEKQADGSWKANEWIKKAILLHFRTSEMRAMEAGALHFYDKVDVQGDWAAKGARVVPPATVREGAYIAPGAILMPSYVNIGAYVDSGTMVDTWSTVGSCAQIGKNCHLSGGVGIGGVLEPMQATPVIIEDNVFIGARSEVAEGCIVREGAVMAMGCYMGKSTKIYNAMTGETIFGEIPERAVVVPGALPSRDGSHQTYALIIKKIRDEKTDARTALNDTLR
ncbi:2,3,4,5-tetrahydropyridine-2,6-dicarboxylate N-succinyltransferase [bacterium]|nr:2,3,4,5-tetrahydropyridine-2,6-dicarboxylate N-succinyltransferase [bacterium]